MGQNPRPICLPDILRTCIPKPHPNLWARTKYSDSVCIQSSMPSHKLSNLEPTHKANVLQPARSTSNHILHV